MLNRDIVKRKGFVKKSHGLNYGLDKGEKVKKMVDKTEEKQQRVYGRPFERGQSGNLNGRPKGTRNKTVILLENMIDGEAEEICRTVINLAKSGDLQAAKILLDRILPAKKDRPVSISLPKVTDTKSAKEALSTIFEAMSEGEITPLEGEAFIKVIEMHNRTIEMLDFEERLKSIEEKLNIDEG